MKSRLSILIAIAVALLTTACDNGDLDISRTVTIDINLSEVINYEASNSSHRELYSDADVMVVALIYGKDGILQKEYQQVCSDFSGICTFETTLSGASQTLVCFCYGVAESSLQAFTITDKERLSTLRISKEDIRYSNNPWIVLGGEIIKMDAQSSLLDVTLRPLGSWVYLHFINIHGRGLESPAPQSYTFWHHSNDQIGVENGAFKAYTSLSSSTLHWIHTITPSECSDYEYLKATYWFPGTFEICGSANFSDDKDKEYFGSQNVTTVAGQQYVMIMDCATSTITFRSGAMN